MEAKLYTIVIYNHKYKTYYSLGLTPMTFKQAYIMRSKFTHYKHRSIQIRKV